MVYMHEIGVKIMQQCFDFCIHTVMALSIAVLRIVDDAQRDPRIRGVGFLMR